MSLADTTSTVALSEQRRLPGWLSGALKFVFGILLCMTPATALIVLGWLTRKTAFDVGARIKDGRTAPWPNFIFGENRDDGSYVRRWRGGLWDNLKAGARALGVVAIWTLPFALLWLTGWFAGWETSFTKAYELSGIWPGISLLAVLLALPAFTLLPMAIAHQAASGRFADGLDLRTIWRTMRRAGVRYLGLTLLFAVGGLGVFGARGLPTFAEHMSPLIRSGDPDQVVRYANGMRLLMTVLLFTGLIVIRHVMARVYARAVTRGAQSGWITTGFVVLACATLWLGLIFSIYVAQFLNYSPWFWLNQPQIGLPWIGSY